MMKLLLATRNPGKRKELEALLAGLTLEIIYPEALDDLREVEETGADYAENARLKAITLAARHGLWTLADDTGLEVEALGGAPGVHSARLVPALGAPERSPSSMAGELPLRRSPGGTTGRARERGG